MFMKICWVVFFMKLLTDRQTQKWLRYIVAQVNICSEWLCVRPGLRPSCLGSWPISSAPTNCCWKRTAASRQGQQLQASVSFLSLVHVLSGWPDHMQFCASHKTWRQPSSPRAGLHGYNCPLRLVSIVCQVARKTLLTRLNSAKFIAYWCADAEICSSCIRLLVSNNCWKLYSPSYVTRSA